MHLSDVLTVPQFRAFLRSDPERVFDMNVRSECAIAQYLRSRGFTYVDVGGDSVYARHPEWESGAQQMLGLDARLADVSKMAYGDNEIRERSAKQVLNRLNRNKAKESA